MILIKKLCKTLSFLAKVNVSSYQVLSFCTILLYLSILLRLLVGPFTYAGVVVFHYWTRITIVSFVTMLTFKTVLTTLFIIDFNRMTSIPEKRVLHCMWMVIFFVTLSHLVHEFTLRQTFGYHHFGRMCFNLYLGKVGKTASCAVSHLYI